MSILDHDAAGVNSEASTWPAWTDEFVWEPNEPTPHSAESISVGTLAQLTGQADDGRGAFYVEHRVDGEIIEFRPFGTHAEARRHAARLFGEGGAVDGESSPFEIELVTTSALDHFLAGACPDPEPELSVSGRWVEPGFDTPTGGID